MATYLELKEQAEKLLAEAEKMRVIELNDVIADIKEKMKTYGVTVQDLGGTGAVRRNRAQTAKAIVRYRSPNGETWSGGRGRKPKWVVDALAQGKDMKEFAV